MHLGAERVREAKLQTPKADFENLKMKETESVDDFAMRLTSAVNQIRTLGEKLEEAYAVKKFLRAASSKFLPILSAIEQFGDMKSMTIEEVAGRLKAHEERLHSAGEDVDEHILLTRAEWRSQENRYGTSAMQGRESEYMTPKSRQTGRGRGRNSRGRGANSHEYERSRRGLMDKSRIRCYNCERLGHFASECRSKPREEISNLTLT